MDHLKLFFKGVTFFGNFVTFLLVIVFFVFFDSSVAVRLSIIFLVSLLIALLIRLIYFKKRPDNSSADTLWLRVYNSSFPSVHAMRSIELAYFFSMLVSGFSLLFWLFAFLICYSRIYLKRHDWVDVLVGGLIGLGLIFFIL